MPPVRSRGALSLLTCDCPRNYDPAGRGSNGAAMARPLLIPDASDTLLPALPWGTERKTP